MTLNSARTSTATIEYQLSPNPGAPTLLFLHGLGANLTQFAAQHRFFADRFQVLSVNLPGHGNSSASAAFSLAACAQNIIELSDALSIDRFHLVGNSMGGNVGYELLHAYAPRLLSVATFGTTAELNTSETTTRLLTFTYKLLPVALLAQLAGSAGQTSASKQVIKAMMRQVDKGALLEIVPLLARFNYLPVIAASQTPFLILKGGKDTDINNVLASTVAAFEARGNYRLVELDSAGHFANLDDPERFNAHVLEFLLGFNRLLDVT